MTVVVRGSTNDGVGIHFSIPPTQIRYGERWNVVMEKPEPIK
jgi:hypothetical protein